MTGHLFINGRFLTQRVTGVQRFALETLLALDKLLSMPHAGADRPMSVVVLAPPGATTLALQNIELRCVGPLTGHAWEQWTLPARTGRAPLLSFCPTGPLLKREQVVTIHDAAVRVVPESYSRKFRIWYKISLPALVRRTPWVMTVSNFSKSELVRHFGAVDERIRVTGEGWQHMAKLPMAPSAVARNGLTPRGYVLAVSSLSPHKNFAVVARALRRLAQQQCAVQVAVAGAVDRTVFGAADLGGGGPLKLLGYVSDSELRSLYESAAAFVFPSLYEGFGLPPLEAMSAGCPVIASNAGAIPEVCGNAAAYFDPTNDEELAALIRRILSSADEREQLIRRGRERLRHYSWEQTARAYLALIEEWLGRSPVK
jgi:glycosyltransferase involved in cell wall biosynthesis